MAYDPEARKQSNNALVIGGVALFIVIAGALAYSMSRPAPEPATTIVNNPTRDRVVNNVVTVPVPVDSGPNTVVVQPAPNVVRGSNTTTNNNTKTIERNTTTVKERVIAAPQPTVTVNDSKPEPTEAPATEPAATTVPADSAPAAAPTATGY